MLIPRQDGKAELGGVNNNLKNTRFYLARMKTNLLNAWSLTRIIVIPLQRKAAATPPKMRKIKLIEVEDVR